jgi:hypothetical protein
MDNQTDGVGTENQGNVGGEAPAQDAAQDVLDLDSVSSWKFQGNTYTPDQWNEIFQGYQKYGEASKYVDEDKAYWANVNTDIDKVLKNPSRAQEFKQVYPERFHYLLEAKLGSQSGRVHDNSAKPGQAAPDEFMQKFQTLEQKLKAFEDRAFQSEVEAASAKIDAILPKLLEKYELADQDRVLMEAERLINKGMKLTDSTWDRIAKEDHDKATKRADKYYQAKLKSQINQGKKGADIGAGGSPPGQAPVKPKTFAEAQEAMIASLKANGGLR